MKDRLVFVKTPEAGEHNCVRCDLEDICVPKGECDRKHYYKLQKYEPLKASKISVKLTGLNQDYEVVEEVIEIPDTGESVTTKESFFDRGSRYDFKKEDPEKIPSLYEHNKARFELLGNSPMTQKQEIYDELRVLKDWLERNKPTKWETCTKENTKVGSKVRRISAPCETRKDAIVDHIFREMECCSVWFPDEEKTVVNYNLHAFEINIYKE